MSGDYILERNKRIAQIVRKQRKEEIAIDLVNAQEVIATYVSELQEARRVSEGRLYRWVACLVLWLGTGITLGILLWLK